MVVLRGCTQESCVVIAVEVVDGLAYRMPFGKAPWELVVVRPIDLWGLDFGVESPSVLPCFIDEEYHANCTFDIVLWANGNRVISLYTQDVTDVNILPEAD